MKKLFGCIIAFLLLGSFSAYSQFNFIFLPEVYGRNVDGLGMFKVQNLLNKDARGSIVITVTENRSRTQVVSIVTPITYFNPGLVSFPKTVFNRSRFNYSGNRLAALVNQTRNFPPGDYTFCFRFVPDDKQSTDEYEDCFDASIEPLVPLSLITPDNGDTICLKRPVLTWQPPMPYSSNMRFRLVLTMKTGRSGTESLLKNTPLLVLDNISTTTLNYPSNYPELKEGKTYCWQVTAYQLGVVISRSEVWQFTVQCNEAAIPVPTDSYRELKLLSNGNYYIANGFMKFSFQNNYSVNQLSYAIQDIENGNKAIRNLPELKVNRGLNKIDLDLTELGLKAGQHYLLKIFPFNDLPIEVRFIYQEPNY